MNKQEFIGELGSALEAKAELDTEDGVDIIIEDWVRLRDSGILTDDDGYVVTTSDGSQFIVRVEKLR